MANKGYDDSGSSDLYLMMGMVAFVLAYFLSIKYFYIIAEAWRYIKIFELTLFSWVPDSFPIWGNLELQRAREFLTNANSREILPSTVKLFDNHYTKYFAWIPGALVLYWGIKFQLKGDSVANGYNMETLLQKNASLYSPLTQYVKEHPEKEELKYSRTDSSTHRHARSISPGEYALMSPPLGLEKEAKSNEMFRNPIWDGEVSFDMDLAERAFKAQLGKTYSGKKEFSGPELKIYDFLSSRLSVDPDEMTDLVSRIVTSIANKKSTFLKEDIPSSEKALYVQVKRIMDAKTKGKPDLISAFSEHKNILKVVGNKSLSRYFKEIAAERVMMKHAYTRTGMMSLLDAVRSGGVQECYAFIWLKSQDRVLWYALNSTGRRVSFTESAGCFAHWLIEKQIDRPLSHPEVTEAVDGLYRALKLHIKPDE